MSHQTSQLMDTSISTEVKPTSCSKAPRIRQIDHSSDVASSIYRLYSNREFSDVTLVVQGVRFPAHRVILAARSNYFRALLYGGMAESSRSVIHLNDISATAFKHLLHYVYTGKLNVGRIRVMLEVLGLAHQYDFSVLQSALSVHLTHRLRTTNIWMIYNVAVMYNLDDLVNACLRFFDGIAPSPLRSPYFLQLSVAAVELLLSRDSFCADEIDIFRSLLSWFQVDAAPVGSLDSNDTAIACSRENGSTDLVSHEVHREVWKRLIQRCVRLELIPIQDLLSEVRLSGLVSPDRLLDAISRQVESPVSISHRGWLLPNVNLASRRFGCCLLSGEAGCYPYFFVDDFDDIDDGLAAAVVAAASGPTPASIELTDHSSQDDSDDTVEEEHEGVDEECEATHEREQDQVIEDSPADERHQLHSSFGGIRPRQQPTTDDTVLSGTDHPITGLANATHGFPEQHRVLRCSAIVKPGLSGSVPTTAVIQSPGTDTGSTRPGVVTMPTRVTINQTTGLSAASASETRTSSLPCNRILSAELPFRPSGASANNHLTHWLLPLQHRHQARQRPSNRFQVCSPRSTVNPPPPPHSEHDVVRHSLDDPDANIVIRLGRPSIVNTIRMQLWDLEIHHSSYSYAVDVSLDQVTWQPVVRYHGYLCRSWQTIHFSARVVRFIRITGSRNTANRTFHLITFRCLYTEHPCRQIDGFLVPNYNVASVEHGAIVLEGVSRHRNALIDGNARMYDWNSGYTCHQLGNGAIVVQLAQPFFLRSMRFLLWDLDDRTYSYSVYVSTDLNNWHLVRDASRENCRSWQVINFPLRLVTFIRIIGTHNTANEVFHLVHLECPYPPSELEKKINDVNDPQAGGTSPSVVNLSAPGGNPRPQALFEHSLLHSSSYPGLMIPEPSAATPGHLSRASDTGAPASDDVAPPEDRGTTTLNTDYQSVIVQPPTVADDEEQEGEVHDCGPEVDSLPLVASSEESCPPADASPSVSLRSSSCPIDPEAEVADP